MNIDTERVAIDGLPKGTTEWLERSAKTNGFTKKNGKPNVSDYLRSLIAKAKAAETSNA